jgi:hypothetical protein
MNKTTAQYLANAFKVASLRVQAIRKASHILSREGIETDWKALGVACDPHETAMQDIQRILSDNGYELASIIKSSLRARFGFKHAVPLVRFCFL